MSIIQLSGAIAPIESMPRFFQFLSWFEPLLHYVAIARSLVLKGVAVEALQPNIVMLFIFAGLLLSISVSRFRSQLNQFATRFTLIYGLQQDLPDFLQKHPSQDVNKSHLFKRMLFSTLLELPFDSDSETIDINEIKQRLPNTPSPVVEQVYSDHGRKTEFQNLYRNIDISSLTWEITPISASKICKASMHPRFQGWHESVQKRVARLPKDGWKCIDTRKKVIQHWSTHMTWLTPPVLFCGDLLNFDSELHLVEGHTRCGILTGFCEQNLIDMDSQHLVWLATNQHSAQAFNVLADC